MMDSLNIKASGLFSKSDFGLARNGNVHFTPIINYPK
jgi:hypothetical protein